MLRTIALAFVLVAAAGALGYAQNMRGFQPLSVKNPRTLAGQVNSDGTIAQGTHFSVLHVDKGTYEITFDEHYFSYGCPIITLTAVSSIGSFGVFVKRCYVYYVDFEGPAGHFQDTAFNLIAVAAPPALVAP